MFMLLNYLMGWYKTLIVVQWRDQKKMSWLPLCVDTSALEYIAQIQDTCLSFKWSFVHVWMYFQVCCNSGALWMIVWGWDVVRMFWEMGLVCIGTDLWAVWYFKKILSVHINAPGWFFYTDKMLK